MRGGKKFWEHIAFETCSHTFIDVCSFHAIFVCQSEMEFCTHQFQLFVDFIGECVRLLILGDPFISCLVLSA